MAKKTKKYYWIKLKDDFFRQKEIKKLRKVAGGDTYTVIYLKMLLLALKNENKLYFEGVEDDFAEELALELDEESDNVKMTLAFLQNQNLIEMINEDEYLLPQCESMTGSESDSAERVRKYRSKKKEQKTLHCNTDVTTSNKKLTTEKEIDIEKELEKEIDIEKEKSNYIGNSENLKKISRLHEENLGLINGVSAEWIRKLSEWIDYKLFKRAIEIATDANKCSPGYVKGIIKQWTDKNITTYDQLKAYELQKKSQKGVKPDVRRREGVIETKGTEDNSESEAARRAELLRQIRELEE